MLSDSGSTMSAANDEIRRVLGHGMPVKRQEMQFRIVRRPPEPSPIDWSKFIFDLGLISMTPKQPGE